MSEEMSQQNCGGWHIVHRLRERMHELEEDLADAGHPLCNDNEHLVRKALQALVKERDAFREMNEKLKTELADEYSADNEIQEIARKIETENEKLEALLERIEKHPHCEEGCINPSQIRTRTYIARIGLAGQATGHICAAAIAKERHGK